MGLISTHISHTSPHSGPKSNENTWLTIYHIPRIMVPVRTWQQRQQLVEYHRSHGEIIFNTLRKLGYFMNAVDKKKKKKNKKLITQGYDVQKRRSSRRYIQRSVWIAACVFSARGLLAKQQPLICFIPDSRDQRRIFDCDRRDGWWWWIVCPPNPTKILYPRSRSMFDCDIFIH